MSKYYNQLSLIQRYLIEAFLKVGIKQKKIAEAINVDPSTISRELCRNTAKRGRTAGEYVAENASGKRSRGTITSLRQPNFRPSEGTGC
jgi:IS30 family transposase